MGYNQGISTYKEMQFHTADQGKLIVMLYERLAQELYRAKEFIEKKDLIGKGEAILKSQNIIMELINSLDVSAGQIALNLQSLYFFTFRELNLINLHKDITKLEKVIQVIENLKFAWEEIAINNPKTKPQTATAAARVNTLSIVE